MEYTEDLCSGNKFCIDSMVKAGLDCNVKPPIKMKKFPKKPTGGDPKKNDTETDPVEEAKCNITDPYGVPCKKDKKVSKTDPSMDDFMKAINTIKIIGGKLGG